ERLAGEQGHDQEGLATLGLADVEDLDDVAVGEAPGGAGLAEEALAEGVGLAVDQLEGDLPLGALVDGRPDDPHRPLAEEAVDAVLSRNQGPGGQDRARLPPPIGAASAQVLAQRRGLGAEPAESAEPAEPPSWTGGLGTGYGAGCTPTVA